MPNRGIKESILTSRTILKLSSDAERFFYRLLLVCDNMGRTDAEPVALRSRCFPIDPRVSVEDVERWRKELEDARLIVVYRVGAREYLQFTKWEKHQEARYRRGATSRFPAPPPELLARVLAEDGDTLAPQYGLHSDTDASEPGPQDAADASSPGHRRDAPASQGGHNVDADASHARPITTHHDHDHVTTSPARAPSTEDEPEQRPSANPEAIRLTMEYMANPKFRPSKRRRKSELVQRSDWAITDFDEALEQGMPPELIREAMRLAAPGSSPRKIIERAQRLWERQQATQPKAPAPTPPARRVRYLIGGSDGEVSAA